MSAQTDVTVIDSETFLLFLLNSTANSPLILPHSTSIWKELLSAVTVPNSFLSLYIALTKKIYLIDNPLPQAGCLFNHKQE